MRPDGVFDIIQRAASMSALLDAADPAGLVHRTSGERIGNVEALLANSDAQVQDVSRPWRLAPVDLQAITACGVTFAASMLEHVVEEQAKGDPGTADGIRATLMAEIGVDLSKVKPGSLEAEIPKQALVRRGLWSQYLEVGIGPDAEALTKAQPMSAVGFGADIGLHPKSAWNNPEPEVVLAVASTGRIVGATLGNDANLRDFKGRSALLLSNAKDNNTSTALGPFLRLFDDSFSLDDTRRAEVALHIEGEGGFVLDGISAMDRISRDPEDLVQQAIGATHQYPDRLVLFLGSMFPPTKERDGGDVVIGSAKLGTLVNRVRTSDQALPWRFGVRALIANLSVRCLLPAGMEPGNAHQMAGSIAP